MLFEVEKTQINFFRTFVASLLMLQYSQVKKFADLVVLPHSEVDESEKNEDDSDSGQSENDSETNTDDSQSQIALPVRYRLNNKK